MDLVKSGSPTRSLAPNDWKHIGIYMLIVFVSFTIADVLAGQYIDRLHEISPTFEVLEHGIGEVLVLIGIIAKKWLQDNRSYVRK